VFFHGYANYEKGVGADYLKMTSCNTTGLIRRVDALDRAVGVSKVAITIIRRVSDPGDTTAGDECASDGQGALPSGVDL
jgi:glyceraldehyde-3-phosphate dehydrogenase (NAD(P))